MAANSESFLRSVVVRDTGVSDYAHYPFSIAAVRALTGLAFHPKVTFFVGENGSGKSTILEAIAVAAGFCPEGGTQNFAFSTRSSESKLHASIRLIRGTRRPRTGYFLRAESYFNVATEIERMDAIPALAPKVIGSYGGKSLHEQSHGESFISLIRNRFGPNGLFILDEPEAALSPQRQLALLSSIDDLVQRKNSQFLIATHSPIVLAYPDSVIFSLSAVGIKETRYEETEHFIVTRDFLLNREIYLHRLMHERADET